MSEDDNKPKVISFATRRAVDTAEPEVVEEGPEIDEDSVRIATEFKEAVEQGRYQSAFVVGWDSEQKCFFSDMILPKDDHPDLSASKLMAYLECVKLELLGIVKGQIITLTEDDVDD